MFQIGFGFFPALMLVVGLLGSVASSITLGVMVFTSESGGVSGE